MQKQEQPIHEGKNPGFFNGRKIPGILLTMTVLAGIPLVLTGCVPGDGVSTASSQAGFFSGVWHGWIAPFSLIYQLFDKDISIYETNNIGFWYDFGFYIAVISGFGSIALSRKKVRTRRDAPSQD